ncbi:hypothetical protein MSCUN_11280 [Methanosphaera cuniculi]|uniref:Uncharacterized protein n=1 Tax=Methanosphaera cuniculi TaxID=1077256 RepID=A0A2V2BQA6_9EURY|nr:hypothetical protein MSCUN_11280 [Methanosphaera cuniculi]
MVKIEILKINIVFLNYKTLENKTKLVLLIA